MIISLLRRLKFSYALYNFFHPGALRHNLPVYRQLGLKKRYFSPISSKDFIALPGYQAAAGLPDLSHLLKTAVYQQAGAASRASLEQFNENGFAVVEGFLSAEKIAAINSEVDRLLQQKKARLIQGRKIMFAFHQSELLAAAGQDAALTELLSVLIGGKAKLFQSMNFMYGSEQATHSDSIHMTTYPLGGLLGVWIALEPVTDENGPLHYYPGSHLLPYYLNADYDNEGSWGLTGKKNYAAYEAMIAEKISGLGLKKQVWKPQAGDMMIWHANLFHGGEPRRDPSKTRKSLVLHYFKEGVVCYHEITQRPALLRW